MIDGIAPQPGHVVLEVAAGPGDTGFLAAELIHPGGRLICTDGAEAMVAAARKRAAELGIANAEFVAMEAEWLDMAAASVDAILCRYGYMLLPDPEAALREARRVLRPGGRLALAVWDSPEVNPELTAGRIALKEIGKWEEPPADAPGPFALADPARLRELLENAGFTEITVDAVDISVEPGTLDDAFAMLSALSPSLRAGLEDLSPAEHTHLRDAFDDFLAPYVAEDGSVVIPGRTLVAAASA
jgi:SAM-dependent methyltransferase